MIESGAGPQPMNEGETISSRKKSSQKNKTFTDQWHRSPPADNYSLQPLLSRIRPKLIGITPKTINNKLPVPISLKYGKLYRLTENEKAGWELHISDI